MQDILTYSAIAITLGFVIYKTYRNFSPKAKTNPSCHSYACSGCGLKEACKK